MRIKLLLFFFKIKYIDNYQINLKQLFLQNIHDLQRNSLLFSPLKRQNISRILGSSMSEERMSSQWKNSTRYTLFLPRNHVISLGIHKHFIMKQFPKFTCIYYPQKKKLASSKKKKKKKKNIFTIHIKYTLLILRLQH